MKGSEMKFLSTRELGVLLGVTRQTIRNWFLKGQIKAYRIGQNIKIPRSEAVRILQRFEQPIPEWFGTEDPQCSSPLEPTA
ncbi:MAG: helix-turn-helix domain-containing protein [Desulfatiglandaceae bacterium]|jgi:excisionase family DNA binding protein